MTQNEWLIEWWELFNNEERNQYQLLKIASNTRGNDEPMPRQRLKALRRQFVTNHVCRKRYPMSAHCALHPEWDNPETFLIRHHILALKNWGSNRRLNIITLCDRCHHYFHPWLPR